MAVPLVAMLRIAVAQILFTLRLCSLLAMWRLGDVYGLTRIAIILFAMPIYRWLFSHENYYFIVGSLQMFSSIQLFMFDIEIVSIMPVQIFIVYIMLFSMVIRVFRCSITWVNSILSIITCFIVFAVTTILILSLNIMSVICVVLFFINLNKISMCGVFWC